MIRDVIFFFISTFGQIVRVVLQFGFLQRISLLAYLDLVFFFNCLYLNSFASNSIMEYFTDNYVLLQVMMLHLLLIGLIGPMFFCSLLFIINGYILFCSIDYSTISYLRLFLLYLSELILLIVLFGLYWVLLGFLETVFSVVYSPLMVFYSFSFLIFSFTQGLLILTDQIDEQKLLRFSNPLVVIFIVWMRIFNLAASSLGLLIVDLFTIVSNVCTGRDLPILWTSFSSRYIWQYEVLDLKKQLRIK